MKDSHIESLKRLEDIEQAITDIEKYVLNENINSFCEKDILHNAVMLKFIIIGEAINHVGNDKLDKYDYPWYKVRSFIGSIHGGNRSNIIPEQVEMMGTIRALSSDDEKMLIERIRTSVTKTAESAGANAEVKIPYSVRYPVTYNDPALTEKMLPSLKNTAGADKVVLVPAETGAEDFSYYQEKAPGVYIFLGGMPKGKDPKTAASHHTPDFFIDESGFSLGVKALSNLAIDYMEMSVK